MPTMGATLEAVPLRSTLPTGLMTMRYQIPTLRVAPAGDVTTTSTTPKVATVIDVTTSATTDETAARKGGEAR